MQEKQNARIYLYKQLFLDVDNRFSNEKKKRKREVFLFYFR